MGGPPEGWVISTGSGEAETANTGAGISKNSPNSNINNLELFIIFCSPFNKCKNVFIQQAA
jgi:hypothetical protein